MSETEVTDCGPGQSCLVCNACEERIASEGENAAIVAAARRWRAATFEREVLAA